MPIGEFSVASRKGACGADPVGPHIHDVTNRVSHPALGRNPTPATDQADNMSLGRLWGRGTHNMSRFQVQGWFSAGIGGASQ